MESFNSVYSSLEELESAFVAGDIYLVRDIETELEAMGEDPQQAYNLMRKWTESPEGESMNSAVKLIKSVSGLNEKQAITSLYVNHGIRLSVAEYRRLLKKSAVSRSAKPIKSNIDNVELETVTQAWEAFVDSLGGFAGRSETDVHPGKFVIFKLRIADRKDPDHEWEDEWTNQVVEFGLDPSAAYFESHGYGDSLWFYYDLPGVTSKVRPTVSPKSLKKSATSSPTAPGVPVRMMEAPESQADFLNPVSDEGIVVPVSQAGESVLFKRKNQLTRRIKSGLEVLDNPELRKKLLKQLQMSQDTRFDTGKPDSGRIRKIQISDVIRVMNNFDIPDGSYDPEEIIEAYESRARLVRSMKETEFSGTYTDDDGGLFMPDDEYSDDSEPDQGRYQYREDHGGVVLTDIQSGEDVFLQPGDDANTFLNEVETSDGSARYLDMIIGEYFYSSYQRNLDKRGGKTSRMRPFSK